MLGDGGGSYQVAEGNDLVDPGQYGIAVASGDHMTIRNNRVYARAQTFTNVGISVWNQYPHACRDITVEGNFVKWQSKDGSAKPVLEWRKLRPGDGHRHQQLSSAAGSGNARRAIDGMRVPQQRASLTRPASVATSK